MYIVQCSYKVQDCHKNKNNKIYTFNPWWKWAMLNKIGHITMEPVLEDPPKKLVQVSSIGNMLYKYYKKLRIWSKTKSE
jgi:hypothetical protein